MFDTGADLNVINSDLTERLVKQNPAINMYKSNTKVTCTNELMEKFIWKVKLYLTNVIIIMANVSLTIMPNVFLD